MLTVQTLAACVLAAATGCAVAQTVKVQTSVAAKAVPGTEMTCKGKAENCVIVVRVGPDPASADDCIATIDIETVGIKRDIPFNFVLVRDSMTDKTTCEFVDKGIVWDPPSPAPTADPFEFVSLTAGNTVANWKAGKTRADAACLPNVKRSGGLPCKPGDPKFANDG